MLNRPSALLTNYGHGRCLSYIGTEGYADLSESDVQAAQGFRFTRPLRTILDLIEAGTVERRFILQALTQALDRGLITRHQIRNASMSGPARKMVEEALRRAA